MSEATFQGDVIERSLQVPVVVEFWSPRSQASVGPVLAALSTEYAGKFLLARIDIDANPQLAQAVGVQAVPLVIAVLRGQVVPLFQGGVGEPEARQYIDQLLTVAVANGITGRAEPVGPAAPEGPAAEEDAPNPRYEKAENAIGAGDLDGAIAAYEELLKENPSDAEAKSGLARVQLVKRTQDVPADVRTRAAENPTDIEAQMLVADVDLMGGHVDDAFARLISTVQATSGDDRNAVRLHLLELFDVVGADDERVIKARRRLMAALF
ncbi:tetratricopeptide repeat protein [Kribbella sp. NPDC048915]|uniref:tetratricopeptide repeat protein n=1 Tax=Kribbella sp. NPDC048915 TaxID=3155148 RepID=UPI0033E5703B